MMANQPRMLPQRRPDEAQPFHVAWVPEVSGYRVYKDAGSLRRLWLWLRHDQACANMRGRVVYPLYADTFASAASAWEAVALWATHHRDRLGAHYALRQAAGHRRVQADWQCEMEGKHEHDTGALG